MTPPDEQLDRTDFVAMPPSVICGRHDRTGPPEGMVPLNSAGRQRAMGAGQRLTDQRLKNYQRPTGPLIAPDRVALRTSSIVTKPPGAVPPHSNRVASGVQ